MKIYAHQVPRTAPLRVHALIDSLTWGGAELLLTDLARAAPSAGVALSVGYLVEPLEGAPAAEPLRAAGVTPQLVGTRSLWRSDDLRRVRRQLQQTQPDVVHTHLGYADFLGGLAARSLGLPVLSTVHVMEWANDPSEKVKARLMAAVRRRCAAAVITVSEAARTAYLAHGWDSPAHVLTVHNGVARVPQAGAGPAVRSQLGLAPDALVLAMVTVLRPGKGHDVAIDAVASLQGRFPGLCLLVLGAGPARDEIARLGAPLGDAVRLVGHRDDVMRVLDAVDVLVHPSRIDAFPTALLEAMAAGVPVVATAVGGIPEIVDPGVTGVLLPAPPRAPDLAAALVPLLADPARRRALGAAAQGRFRAEFSAERWMERLLPLYRAAAEGGRPPVASAARR